MANPGWFPGVNPPFGGVQAANPGWLPGANPPFGGVSVPAAQAAQAVENAVRLALGAYLGGPQSRGFVLTTENNFFLASNVTNPLVF